MDAIVTEHGQFPPESIVALMRELFGEGAAEPWGRTMSGRDGDGQDRRRRPQV